MSLITIDTTNIHSVFDLASAIRDNDCSFRDRENVALLLDEMLHDLNVLETRERENELKLIALSELTGQSGDTLFLIRELIRGIISAKGRKKMTLETVDEFEANWENCIPDGAVVEIVDPLIQDIVETVRKSFI